MSKETVVSSLINMHNQLTEMKIFMTNEVMEDPEVFPSGAAAGQLVIASAHINQAIDPLMTAIRALGEEGVDFDVENLGPVSDIGQR